MKKYLCMMLVVILCFSVTAGCGQKTAGPDKPADGGVAGPVDTTPSGDSDGVPAMSKEPITFTMFLVAEYQLRKLGEPCRKEDHRAHGRDDQAGVAGG